MVLLEIENLHAFIILLYIPNAINFIAQFHISSHASSNELSMSLDFCKTPVKIFDGWDLVTIRQASKEEWHATLLALGAVKLKTCLSNWRRILYPRTVCIGQPIKTMFYSTAKQFILSIAQGKSVRRSRCYQSDGLWRIYWVRTSLSSL